MEIFLICPASARHQDSLFRPCCAASTHHIPVADSGMRARPSAQGNASFKAGKFEEAVKHYSAAIKKADAAVLRSNRAMAYLKLGDFKLAEEARQEASAAVLRVLCLLPQLR